MSNVCVECEHHSLEKEVVKYGFWKKKSKTVQVHMCNGQYDGITGESIKQSCRHARYGNRYIHGWCRLGRNFKRKES